MAARKRFRGESYQAYRQHLKSEGVWQEHLLREKTLMDNRGESTRQWAKWLTRKSDQIKKAFPKSMRDVGFFYEHIGLLSLL